MSYWGKPRKRSNNPPEIDPRERAMFARVLEAYEPHTILEVGAGTGRVVKMLQELGFPSSELSACDFPGHLRLTCRERTGVLPDVWDAESLPYDTDQFDLVVSWDVLLHIPPRDVLGHMGELLRVAKRWVYIVTLVSFDKEVAPHVWLHDYGELVRHLDGLGRSAVVEGSQDLGDRCHIVLLTRGERRCEVVNRS